MKLSEITTRAPKILLIGQFGTGKTAFACTLGKYAQVLDLDEGLLTCLNLNDRFKSDRAEIDVISCYEEDAKTPKGFDKAMNALENVMKEIKLGKYPYKALIIDGFTNLAEFAMRKAMALDGKLDSQPEIQHWGARDVILEKFLIRLKALPILVVLIAHTMYQEVGGSSVEVLACKGKSLPPNIPTKFDEVWRCDVFGQEFRLRTIRSTSQPARSRLNVPDKIQMDLGMIEILKQSGYDITK